MKTILFFLIVCLYSLADAAVTAKANLQGKSGSNITGTIEFLELPTAIQNPDAPMNVQIKYTIRGLEKNSRHGFHIHENGDCSAADAKSAGTHYLQIAPTGGTSADTPQRFAGDLPEIVANSEGVAEGTVIAQNLSIEGKNPVKGRAIIVHGGPDDPKKPSAPRVACGVIM